MRTSRSRFVPLLSLVFAFGSALSCGDTAHNDFQQTLEFEGFFTDETCGTGVAGLNISLSVGPAWWITAFQVKNLTTGIMIPSTGGAATGLPVQVTEGVRILLKNIHIEYLLPTGFLPPRDWVINGVMEPGGEACTEFYILSAEDINNIIQDPLSYPPTPFTVNTRVTIQGVTEGGLDIEVSGDIYMIIG